MILGGRSRIDLVASLSEVNNMARTAATGHRSCGKWKAPRGIVSMVVGEELMGAHLPRLWRVGLGVAAVLSVALCGPVAAEKLRVTYPNINGSYIYFFGAIDRGYYREEGLDLEVIEVGGGTATAALMSGDVQFSTSGSSAVSAIIRGAPLKVLLVGEDRPDWQIWSSHPEIRALEDLRGQQIGIISRGDTGEIGIRYLLMKRGLPGDYVAFTPIGSSVAARLVVMSNGSLPAGILRRRCRAAAWSGRAQRRAPRRRSGAGSALDV
jgi:hypothetical protein